MDHSPYIPFVRDVMLRSYRSLYAEQETMRSELLKSYLSMYVDQEMMKKEVYNVLSQATSDRPAVTAFTPILSYIKKACADSHGSLSLSAEEKESFFNAMIDFHSLPDDGTLYFQIMNAHNDAVQRGLGPKITAERVVSSALIYLANKLALRDAELLVSRISLLLSSKKQSQNNSLITE